MESEVFTFYLGRIQQKNVQKTFKELWLNTDLSDVTLATEDSGYCNGGAHHFLNISATGVLIYGELDNKYISYLIFY